MYIYMHIYMYIYMYIIYIYMDAETTVMVHTFIFSTPHAYSLHPMPKPCLNLCHFRPCTGT